MLKPRLRLGSESNGDGLLLLSTILVVTAFTTTAVVTALLLCLFRLLCPSYLLREYQFSTRLTSLITSELGNFQVAFIVKASSRTLMVTRKSVYK